MTTITGFDTFDVRFPTSKQLDGSDAMNPSPDYSAAYLVIKTDSPYGLAGHSFVFTIGRGNDIELAAVRALEPFLAGRDLDAVLDDLGGISRRADRRQPAALARPRARRRAHGDRRRAERLLGPGRQARGQAALAAARRPVPHPARRPGRLSLPGRRADPRRGDRPARARRRRQGRADRLAASSRGYPAYTTTPGWLGYTDEHMVELCKAAVDAGFTQVKLKVGASLTDDLRR